MHWDFSCCASTILDDRTRDLNFKDTSPYLWCILLQVVDRFPMKIPLELLTLKAYFVLPRDQTTHLQWDSSTSPRLLLSQTTLGFCQQPVPVGPLFAYLWHWTILTFLKTKWTWHLSVLMDLVLFNLYNNTVVGQNVCACARLHVYFMS